VAEPADKWIVYSKLVDHIVRRYSAIVSGEIQYLHLKEPTLLTCTSRYLALLLVVILCLAGETQAGGSPKSLAAIKAAVGDSSALSGKVVYVDFWASWCAPCRKSFPWMKQLQSRYADKGLQIVAVSVDKETKLAKEFLAENKAAFSVVYDSTGALAKQFELEAMPTSFVFGRDGTFRDSHRGFNLSDTLKIEKLIKTLLEEKSGK
jgi:cytochrome c biogenesis protein CcmG, thiol:disulfide interchange protein DsbE